MKKEYVYSYVTRSYVEYEPPIDHDAYDEYEECKYYIGELTQSGKTLDSNNQMPVMWRKC